MVFLQKKHRKQKSFRILCWITFFFTIFPKKLAEKSYSTVYFFDIAPASGSMVPPILSKQNQKFWQLFSASFLWKMVKQNVIQHKILNDFCFLRFDCKKPKSYPIFRHNIYLVDAASACIFFRPPQVKEIEVWWPHLMIVANHGRSHR